MKKKKGTNHESQMEVWQNWRFISMKYLLSEKQNFQTESRPLKKHSPIFKTLQLVWHFDSAISREVNEPEEYWVSSPEVSLQEGPHAPAWISKVSITISSWYTLQGVQEVQQKCATLRHCLLWHFSPWDLKRRWLEAGEVSKQPRTGNQWNNSLTSEFSHFSSCKSRIKEAAFDLDCRTHLLSLAVFFPWAACPPFTMDYKDGNMTDRTERASFPSLERPETILKCNPSLKCMWPHEFGRSKPLLSVLTEGKEKVQVITRAGKQLKGCKRDLKSWALSGSGAGTSTASQSIKCQMGR